MGTFIIFFWLGALLILGALTALIEFLQQGRKRKKGETLMEKETLPTSPTEETCCGQHEICEKDSLFSAVSKQIEYYNDEELDSYKNLPPEEYDEKTISEFSEVFYTLREEEIAGWVRSLQLRHIELPLALKEEVLLVLAERR